MKLKPQILRAMYLLSLFFVAGYDQERAAATQGGATELCDADVEDIVRRSYA